VTAATAGTTAAAAKTVFLGVCSSPSQAELPKQGQQLRASGTAQSPLISALPPRGAQVLRPWRAGRCRWNRWRQPRR